MNKLKRLIAISLAAVTALSIPVLSLAASGSRPYRSGPFNYRLNYTALTLNNQKDASGTFRVSRVNGPTLGPTDEKEKYIMIYGTDHVEIRRARETYRFNSDPDGQTSSLRCATKNNKKTMMVLFGFDFGVKPHFEKYEVLEDLF